ncbi:MAG TPA: hypothetical protein VIA18_07120 [Polyangia bacterium]|jgi:hypothetical protein|nr:hypothetical protein [Polyangia bacterium]
MGERSFGARWWRESLATSRLARGGLASTFGLLGGAALTLPGCFNYGDLVPDENAAQQQSRQSGDEIDTSVDALQLQQHEGWDVGQPNVQLRFAGSSLEDVAGTQDWRGGMQRLAETLHPSEPALQPYYVPTLFQSLMGKAGQRLRAVMRPIHDDDMDRDFARGLALREAFASAGWPRDTALVVDAPGPRAVALAAALADHFAPVFTFGNWPHPRGVVPAHETLAATLFYLPAFTTAESERPNDAPPIFVLDANRLAPYRDADAEFDNRYFVHLPDAAALRAMGVSHVLYVSADGHQELDDLNDALVALSQDQIDVQMVALGDFVPAGENVPELAQNDAGDGDRESEAEYEAEGDDDGAFAVGLPFAFFFDPWPWWLGRHWSQARYCYGGDTRGGVHRFWRDHGGFHAPVVVAHGGRVVGPPKVGRPVAVASRWTPIPRATMFNPRGAVLPGVPGARAHVAGFGQVPVRASRFDGHVTAVRGNGFNHYSRTTFAHGGTYAHGGAFSGGFARSGSIGRAGGGSSG